MKLYVSDIEESYNYTIIGHLESSGTADLWLHTVQCWRTCAVDKEKQALPMVFYCSVITYRYYSRLVFPPIKKWGMKIYLQWNIQQYTVLHFYIQGCFLIYKNKLIVHKIELIPHISDSMIPIYFCKKLTIINFTTDYMTSDKWTVVLQLRGDSC